MEGQGHFFTIYFPGFVCFVLYRPRYQVSIYRTIGPLVSHYNQMEACEQNISRTTCARVMIFESHIVFKV